MCNYFIERKTTLSFQPSFFLHPASINSFVVIHEQNSTSDKFSFYHSVSFIKDTVLTFIPIYFKPFSCIAVRWRVFIKFPHRANFEEIRTLLARLERRARENIGHSVYINVISISFSPVPHIALLYADLRISSASLARDSAMVLNTILFCGYQTRTKSRVNPRPTYYLRVLP